MGIKNLVPKAGKLTLMDAVLIALVKTVEERMLSRFIGNGTLMSAGVKIGGAVALSKLVGGKIADIGSTALMVDGAEDLVFTFLGGSAQTQIGSGITAQVEVI